MAEQTLQWFDSVVVSIDSDPAKALEALDGFRKEPQALDAFQYILQTTARPATQFHSANQLQYAVLERWPTIPAAARVGLLQLCWQRACDPSLERFVREKLLQTVALFWKRGWTGGEDRFSDEDKANLFHTIRGHANLQALQQPQAGQGTEQAGAAAGFVVSAGLLTALVIEFSSTKSAALGMPIEFHRETHAAFEQAGLEQTLNLAMEMLSGAVTFQPQTPEGMQRVEASATLCREVLNWEHGFLNVWNIPSQTQVLRLPETWRPYVVRQDLIQALFNVYVTIRAGAAIRPPGAPGHNAPGNVRSLLLLLAGVTGRIFSNAAERSAFAQCLVEGMLRVLGEPLKMSAEVQAAVMQQQQQQGTAAQGNSDLEMSIATAQESETSDLAVMILRLVLCTRFKGIALMPDFAGFLNQLRVATTELLKGAAASVVSGRDMEEDLWELNVAGMMLEGWASLATDALILGNETPSNAAEAEAVATFKQMALPVFVEWVQARMVIQQTFAMNFDDDDVNDEILASEEEDLVRETHDASCLGRISLGPAMQAILEQFPSLTQRLTNIYQQLAQGKASDDQPRLLEEARFLVLLTNSLLMDEATSEAAAIPLLILRAAGETGVIEGIIALTNAVFTLLELDMEFGASGGHMSPLLSETYLTFAQQWVQVYLEPEPEVNRLERGQEATAPLRQPAFRCIVENYTVPVGTPAHAIAELPAAKNARFLLRAVWVELQTWPMEPGVVKGACDILKWLTLPHSTAGSGLLALPHPPPAAAEVAAQGLEAFLPVALKLPEFDELVAAHGNADPSQIPSRIYDDGRAMLMESLVSGSLAVIPSLDSPALALGAGGGGVQAPGLNGLQRFDVLMAPLEQRLEQLVLTRAAAVEQGQATEISSTAMESKIVLRLYTGVVRAVTTTNFSFVSDRLQRSFELIVRLMKLVVVPAEHMQGAAAMGMQPSGAKTPSDYSAAEPFLAFLRDFAEIALPCLPSDATVPFFGMCQEMLRMYASAASSALSMGRASAALGTDSAELYDDVQCALELLSHIVTKDFIDYAPQSQAATQQIDILGCVFFGIATVLPLLTPELLQIPSICLAFFGLIGFVSSDYSDRFQNLETGIFASLAKALDFGFRHDDAKIARESLKGIEGLVAFHLEEIQAHRPGLLPQFAMQAQSGTSGADPSLLVTWLRGILEVAITKDHIYDRIDSIADAMLVLIICGPQEFEGLVNQFIASQHESLHERIRAAFGKLVGGQLQMKYDKHQRKNFRSNLKAFLEEARMFLLVK